VGRFLNAPETHRARLERLPGRVEQTLVRALAVHAPDRFHTPLAFADALEAAASGTAKLDEPAVHAVLRRAAELEVERPTESGALSLGAVEQVAAQVGIPPQHVRAAAREVAGAARHVAGAVRQVAGALPFDLSRQPAPLRAPPEGFYDKRRRTYVVERAVEREVTAAEHAALVMEIQDGLRTTGQTTVLGGGFTWSQPPALVGGMPWAGIPARPEGRQVTVTIAPDAGRTRIRIEEQLGGATGAAATAAMVGGLLAAGLAGIGFLQTGGGPMAGLLIAPAIALVGFGVVFGSKVYLDRLVRGRGPELAALAERLAVRIASKLPVLPGPGPSPSRG